MDEGGGGEGDTKIDWDTVVSLTDGDGIKFE